MSCTTAPAPLAGSEKFMASMVDWMLFVMGRMNICVSLGPRIGVCPPTGDRRDWRSLDGELGVDGTGVTRDARDFDETDIGDAEGVVDSGGGRTEDPADGAGEWLALDWMRSSPPQERHICLGRTHIQIGRVVLAGECPKTFPSLEVDRKDDVRGEDTGEVCACPSM